MMTGIICSSRRMMYLPTRHPLSSRFGRAIWIATQRRPRQQLAHSGPTVISGPISRATQFHFTLIEVKSMHPNGVTLTSVTRSDQPTPACSSTSAWSGSPVARMASASWYSLFASSRRRRRGRLHQLGVELRVAVVDVVGTAARAVQRSEEVLDRRVVHLPAGRNRPLISRL